MREEVVGLEDDADLATVRAQCLLLKTKRPAVETDRTVVGMFKPARIRRRVDFPPPDGPINAIV